MQLAGDNGYKHQALNLCWLNSTWNFVEFFCHLSITSCSREKRYQALPAFPYCKQQVRGRAWERGYADNSGISLSDNITKPSQVKWSMRLHHEGSTSLVAHMRGKRHGHPTMGTNTEGVWDSIRDYCGLCKVSSHWTDVPQRVQTLRV